MMTKNTNLENKAVAAIDALLEIESEIHDQCVGNALSCIMDALRSIQYAAQCCKGCGADCEDDCGCPDEQVPSSNRQYRDMPSCDAGS